MTLKASASDFFSGFLDGMLSAFTICPESRRPDIRSRMNELGIRSFEEPRIPSSPADDLRALQGDAVRIFGHAEWMRPNLQTAASEKKPKD